MQKENRKQLEVFEACDNLRQRGENITIEAVGRELVDLGYKRGSSSHVGQYVKEWRKQRERLHQENSVPSPRPDKLSAVIDEIRAESWREARQELDAYKAESEKQISILNETIRYSQQEITNTRQHYEVAQNKNSTLTDELQNLKKENDNLSKLLKKECLEHQTEKQLHADYRNNAESEKRRLSDQYEQLVSLHKETLDNHKQQLGLLLEQYEQQRHQHVLKIDEGKTQINRLEISTAKLIQERDGARSEVKRIESELSMARTQYTELEKGLESIAKNIEQQYRQWYESNQSPPPYLTDYFSKIETKLCNYAGNTAVSNQTLQNIQQQLADHSFNLQKLLALADNPKP